MSTPKAPHESISADGASEAGGFQLPVETEIYLLPDGQVVIADMPAELAHLLEQIGSLDPTDSVCRLDGCTDALPVNSEAASE